MTTPRRSPAAVISHGHLYAIGGYNGLFLKSVERVAIRPDGSLSAWAVLPTQLSTDRYIHGVGHIGDNIYIVGGHIADAGGGKNSAEWSSIQPDGNLTPWQPTETIHHPRFLASTVAAGSFIFTLGGYDSDYLDSVERTSVKPDGSLNPWEAATPISRAKEGGALAYASNDKQLTQASSGIGRLYLVGGSAGGQYLQDVEWAVVNDRGELGYWTTRSSSGGLFSAPAPPPPPQRPTLEEAHSAPGEAGSSP
jgi:hypothetical protein